MNTKEIQMSGFINQPLKATSFYKELVAFFFIDFGFTLDKSSIIW